MPDMRMSPQLTSQRRVQRVAALIEPAEGRCQRLLQRHVLQCLRLWPLGLAGVSL
jgi:hypothetical protein